MRNTKKEIMDLNVNKNMFMRKGFAILVLFCFSAIRMNAQVKPSGVYIGDTTCSVQCYFDNADRKMIDTICLRSCIFIKFQLDDNGTPVNIAFNHLATPIIRKFVLSTLNSTAGKWVFTDKKLRKKVKRKEYILLPFVFSFFSGKCDSKDTSFDNILGMLNYEDTSQNNKPENPAYLKASYFNGVLLNPVFLVSTYK